MFDDLITDKRTIYYFAIEFIKYDLSKWYLNEATASDSEAHIYSIQTEKSIFPYRCSW